MRIGINGFGRIGRTLLRAICDRSVHDSKTPVVVGINDRASTQTMAHLLQFDSSQGTWMQEVSYDDQHLMIHQINKPISHTGYVPIPSLMDTSSVHQISIPVSHTRDPLEIPWDQWQVDVVVDCTGAFKTKEDLSKHIKGSVKKVLISAPAPGADLTICYGVNHKEYDSQQHTLVSNASCTTNCLAPLVKVLDDEFGLISGFMTTVHAYTNDQKLLDSNHKDLRRARAAGLSIIPTTTGAAQTVGKILPHLKGKIDGISVRVPTPNVSLVDFVARLNTHTTAEQINTALIESSKKALKGVLAIEELPLVSRDFLGHPASCIVDVSSTMVLEGSLVKVLAWYDNEVGFSHRMVDLLEML